MKKCLLIIVAAICAVPVSAVQPVKKSATAADCDISVIEPSIRKEWKSNKGHKWTTIQMNDGFALCVFSNRYVLFDGTPDSFVSIRPEKDDIIMDLGSVGGKVAMTWMLDIAKMMAESQPYRGYKAEAALWATAYYDDPDSDAASSVVYKAGMDVESRSGRIISNLAGGNAFWNQSESVKNLKKWVSEEVAKENWASMKSFEPEVRLVLNLKLPPPPAALQPGQVPVSVTGTEAGFFKCGESLHAADKNPHKIMLDQDFLR